MIVLFSVILVISLVVTPIIVGETLKESILMLVVEVVIVGLIIVDMIGGF